MWEHYKSVNANRADINHSFSKKRTIMLWNVIIFICNAIRNWNYWNIWQVSATSGGYWFSDRTNIFQWCVYTIHLRILTFSHLCSIDWWDDHESRHVGTRSTMKICLKKYHGRHLNSVRLQSTYRLLLMQKRSIINSQEADQIKCHSYGFGGKLGWSKAEREIRLFSVFNNWTQGFLQKNNRWKR